MMHLTRLNAELSGVFVMLTIRMVTLLHYDNPIPLPIPIPRGSW